MDHPDVKLLAADGVRPDSDSIARDQYSLIHEFNTVIRADEAQDCPAWILLEWLKRPTPASGSGMKAMSWRINGVCKLSLPVLITGVKIRFRWLPARIFLS